MAKTPTKHLIDVDRITGEYIQGWTRIKQSLGTILTTRFRTRIMRRWWGCDFLNMQDKPGNEESIMDGMMAAISAINTYEPEFKVRRLIVESLTSEGGITVTIEGVDLVDEALRKATLTI